MIWDRREGFFFFNLLYKFTSKKKTKHFSSSFMAPHCSPAVLPSVQLISKACTCRHFTYTIVDGKYCHFDLEEGGTQGPEFEMACMPPRLSGQSTGFEPRSAGSWAVGMATAHSAQGSPFKGHLRLPANPTSVGGGGGRGEGQARWGGE